MRYCLSAVFFCSALLFLDVGNASPPSNPSVVAHFSPHGDCTAAVVLSVADAKQSVFVQAYVLTSQPIATALAEAKARGVAVEVIIDGRGGKMIGSRYTWLLSKGVKVVLDKSHPIAHNKTMVIDGRKVITGSFNFTAQAEKENAENLLVIDDEPLAKKYNENWQLHRKHSMEELRPEEPPPQATMTNSAEETPPCKDCQCGTTTSLQRNGRR